MKTNYTVQFMVSSWYDITLQASSEDEAKEIAQKRMSGIKSHGVKGLTLVDESIKYAGITNNDLLDIYKPE